MWNKTISTERIINRACGQNTFEYGLREGQRSERNVDEEKNIRLTKRASQPICSESHFTRVHIFKHLHTQRIFNVVCVCFECCTMLHFLQSVNLLGFFTIWVFGSLWPYAFISGLFYSQPRIFQVRMSKISVSFACTGCVAYLLHIWNNM